MPIIGGEQRRFVRRIERRRKLARASSFVRRKVMGSPENSQAAVYDATFRSDHEAVAYHYATANDHLPDLAEPVWINEKIRWQFLNHPNPLIGLCADKVGVREFLDWRGARIPAPRLLAVGEVPEELARIDLPERFVLKAAFGSGLNHVVAEGGRSLPRERLVARVRRWMAYDHWRKNGELHYRDIPKRWLVEEYLPTTREEVEYKCVCIHGEPVFFIVVTERDHGGKPGRAGIRHAFYDPDWRRLAVGVSGITDDPAPVPRPPELPLMLGEARRLAADFMHVRVDFLKFDGRLALSELTFSSNGARLPYTPAPVNAAIGAVMDLDQAPAYLRHGRQVMTDLARRAAA
jgi:TupA-like ATPgrasp